MDYGGGCANPVAELLHLILQRTEFAFACVFAPQQPAQEKTKQDKKKTIEDHAGGNVQKGLILHYGVNQCVEKRSSDAERQAVENLAMAFLHGVLQDND